MELIDVPEGLAGVAVAATRIGDVLGEQGAYHYRGRSAIDLARTSSFEQVASLVLDDRDEPAIEPVTMPDALAAVVRLGDLRTAVSAHAALSGLRPLVDIDAEQRRADAVRLISAFPALAASVARRELVQPEPGEGYIAGYLRMLHGAPASPDTVRALETYACLTIEHGFNAGAFTARVVASTGADLGACVTAAYGALTGPRHGAVQTKVLDMLDAIGEPERAADWMRSALASRERIVGFGHAVYRTTDPRAPVLREVCATLSPERHRLALAVEAAAAEVLAGRRLGANVDLYAPIVLEGCDIPRSSFTPTFAVARIVGWCAHVLEQATERKVIRPAAYYVGESYAGESPY